MARRQVGRSVMLQMSAGQLLFRYIVHDRFCETTYLMDMGFGEIIFVQQLLASDTGCKTLSS